MPMPFHCIECNKPISQALNGVCEDCEKKRRRVMDLFCIDLVILIVWIIIISR